MRPRVLALAAALGALVVLAVAVASSWDEWRRTEDHPRASVGRGGEVSIMSDGWDIIVPSDLTGSVIYIGGRAGADSTTAGDGFISIGGGDGP